MSDTCIGNELEMSALDFLKERKRMCDLISCRKCELGSNRTNKALSCTVYINECPEKAVEAVAKWSKEHQLMTNAMKFKEVFGCEPIVPHRGRYICTGNRFSKEVCVESNCSDCKKWWDEEYKAPEGSTE